MKEIETKTGLKLTIDPDVLDDMNVFELIMEVDDGNFKRLVPLLVAILGEDGKDKLYKHVRQSNGRVPASLVAAELENIFNELDPKKKLEN